MKELYMKYSKQFKVIGLGFCDIIILNVISILALWMRFDFRWNSIPEELLDSALAFAPFYTMITLVVFAVMGLYTSLWKYAGIYEMMMLECAMVLTTLFQVIGMKIAGFAMPMAYFIFSFILNVLVFSAERCFSRFLGLLHSQFFMRGNSEERAMIIGAGEAGNIILKEILNSQYLNGQVGCMIDDDTDKQGKKIHGVPVVGGRDEIPWAVEKYGITHIIIAMPSADAQSRHEVLNICQKTGCKLRTLPGIYQMVNGQVSLSRLREVAIEDLLEREPVKVDMDSIAGYVKDKVVMVTGGGGSIGSELCRQIANYTPKQLIIVDIYENNAYDIQQDLKIKHPELNLKVLIGSVRNTNRMEWIFKTYHPELVYHAAAHKHVPLMEESPNEAIKNNVIGTYKIAKMSVKYGVKKFVQISTDKAVNPTNIMGASKRLCEMIIQCMDRKCLETEFAAVRFGNVLGSNGSVIPLFKKQIAEGGPVTVTHPDIIRYFMTIPEAVALVLQAGGYARGGEIFVLDMGEPVKIMDLATNLIKLSGYTPGVDMKIEITGLRPGEKLYEEMLMKEEGMQETENHRIHIGKPIPMDDEWFLEELKILDEESKAECMNIKELVKKVVPEYRDADAVNKKKRHSA